jgi:hypothetical protein
MLKKKELMKYLFLLIITNYASILFGQCNAQPPIENINPCPVRLIPLLADKKETAYEIVSRELRKNEQIEAVYELETWQPNEKVAKTIVANLKLLNDTTVSLNKIILYYPIDKNGFGEFLLDTFVINKPDFKIKNVFTANFDNDSIVEIGLTYSYSLQDSCKSIVYRTVYYKKPINIGVYWEFFLPVFGRINDDRFNCTNCLNQTYECSFDTDLKIKKYLNGH